ncbi:TetR/AcrR family transcriptional regulator [Paenibacillus sp. ACRRY]|uniref:TetR/AcrR family transcriptional regulator n=1 Tax=Paenibacillus sp. ACRRY TaxID=2918208 RepID=UPI001EF4E806|nr:TetR/AcrR family transcriptional regulator [Paenibacillus sp. ACRRY]MCG7381492.1 TetR/AcrR family transcriptional regulator [Paenibacillus sp. ACRRY]
MNQDISLRELKKAKNKIALYEAGLSLMKDRMFSQVMIEDICKTAEISKVTFFKFYQRKEDLLIYFMRVWLTERIIEIEQEGKKGSQAFRHLLAEVAKEHQVRPGMMPSLISFLAEQNMQPCMPELSQAEVSLLFPGHEEAGSQSPNMYVLFQQFMKEEQQVGKLNKSITLEESVQICFTIFYGAFLTAQLYNSAEIGRFYDTHLGLLEI